MSVELLADQGGDEGFGGDGADELEVFGAVVVALHEAGRQGHVDERAGEERAVGDDVDLELFGGV